jgi:hypothetical protein
MIKFLLLAPIDMTSQDFKILFRIVMELLIFVINSLLYSECWLKSFAAKVIYSLFMNDYPCKGDGMLLI